MGPYLASKDTQDVEIEPGGTVLHQIEAKLKLWKSLAKVVH